MHFWNASAAATRICATDWKPCCAPTIGSAISWRNHQPEVHRMNQIEPLPMPWRKDGGLSLAVNCNKNSVGALPVDQATCSLQAEVDVMKDATVMLAAI